MNWVIISYLNDDPFTSPPPPPPPPPPAPLFFLLHLTLWVSDVLHSLPSTADYKCPQAPVLSQKLHLIPLHTLHHSLAENTSLSWPMTNLHPTPHPILYQRIHLRLDPGLMYTPLHIIHHSVSENTPSPRPRANIHPTPLHTPFCIRKYTFA